MTTIKKNATISRFLRRCAEVAWPFGAFQKTTDPQRAIESLERTSASATLWILAGIVVEAVALFMFDHSRLEVVVGMIANGAIGLGLIVEYVVIGRVIDATKEAERESNERIANIEESAAEANARAAEAKAHSDELNLQLMKLTSPRFIGTQALADALGGSKKPTGVQVVYIRDCSDCFILAHCIVQGLSIADWPVYAPQSVFQVEVTAGRPFGMFGVHLEAKSIDFNPGDGSALSRLTSALSKQVGNITFAPSKDLPEGAIRILIGPKM